jgi:hypothetical protein
LISNVNHQTNNNFSHTDMQIKQILASMLVLSSVLVYSQTPTVPSPSSPSLVQPLIWLKTVPVSADLNGKYTCKNIGSADTLLRYYDARGAGYGRQYEVKRSNVRNYNFHPALLLNDSTVSMEVLIRNSNLAQATIMGVWGAQTDRKTTTELKSDGYLMALHGRPKEGVIYTKNAAVPPGVGASPVSSGGTVPNLMYQSDKVDVSEQLFHERALRIATLTKTNRPCTSIWGEEQRAVLTFGNKVDDTNVSFTSTYDPKWKNFTSFKGHLPELLVFNRALTALEQRIYESYLAISYGISLESNYLSATGKVLWDAKTNTTYKNRIAGYGREDVLNLNQRMTTTSCEEAPYYSEMYDSNDSTDLNNVAGLSSRYRLLAMGCQTGEILNDGQYVVYGDDGASIQLGAASFGSAMSRKWMVATDKGAATQPRNWVELSYHCNRAADFEATKDSTYLIIDRTGKGDFTNAEFYKADHCDALRAKIIFANVVWDNDKSGKDVFTFGYKTPFTPAPKANVSRYEGYGTDENGDKANGGATTNYIKAYTKDRTTVVVEMYFEKPSSSTVMIHDVAGRLVYHKVYESLSQSVMDEIKIDYPGVYVVKVMSAVKSLTQRVVVNN